MVIKITVLMFLVFCLTGVYADEIFQDSIADINDLAFIVESRATDNQPGFIMERGSRLDQTNELALAGMLAILFYQNVLSGQAPPSCNFYPSCSQYGLLSVKQYGFFIGVLMASDRLQRCNGRAAGLYPVHKPTGRYYDPPERNHL